MHDDDDRKDEDDHGDNDDGDDHEVVIMMMVKTMVMMMMVMITMVTIMMVMATMILMMVKTTTIVMMMMMITMMVTLKTTMMIAMLMTVIIMTALLVHVSLTRVVKAGASQKFPCDFAYLCLRFLSRSVLLLTVNSVQLLLGTKPLHHGSHVGTDYPLPDGRNGEERRFGRQHARHQRQCQARLGCRRDFRSGVFDSDPYDLFQGKRVTCYADFPTTSINSPCTDSLPVG